MSIRPFVRGYYHIFVSGWGANYLDVDRTFRQIKRAGTEDWARAWGVTAQRTLDQAQLAESRGHIATARELYWRSALYFHIGDYALAEYTEQKQQLYAASVRAYRRHAELAQPPVVRLLVPYKGTSIPGYLHLPPGDGPFPCVIIVPGLGSSKEQPDFPPESIVARGFAAFHMDMPGHGETYPHLLLDYDSYGAVSAAVDTLSTLPSVVASAISVLGTSLGGTIALRAASADRRIASVVSISGFYEPGPWFERSAKLTEPSLRVVTGHRSYQAVRELVHAFTLRGLVKQITCPLLAVHGDSDTIVPVEESRHIYAEAATDKAMIIYPGGDHGVCNSPTAGLDVLDWISHKVRPATPAARATV
jgi:2,6-dihydroxypseudooxynicotine hydrolase